jgi:hypothetical protein
MMLGFTIVMGGEPREQVVQRVPTIVATMLAGLEPEPSRPTRRRASRQ